MKKVVCMVLAAVMLMACLAGCGSTPAPTPEDSASAAFKIGGTAPLTGGAAIYGNAVKNAAQIAVDEINAKGGVQFELRYEDDQNDPEKAVNAYNTLKDWGVQLSLGSVTSKPCEVTAGDTFADRIFALIDEQPEEDHGYVTLVNARQNADGSLEECEERTNIWAWKHPHQADGTITYRKLEGKITMDDVEFSYDGKKTVLHNVTLYGMPGEKIAFVGSTGAGKTTITNLINRFYDIEDGKIRYDDININKIKKSSLRRSLGIVLQDTHLFTGTIMDNIRYGRLDATDEECIAAAKLANADGFIRRLPNGYQTEINSDGGTLSQGERQLLSIARAAVADAPAMILDEATSSIDTRTESLVQKGMDALMNGRTTFVIAHRLSTVQNSDCIMVLENGRIIERGNHDELIAKKGRYYQLYTGNAIGEE